MIYYHTYTVVLHGLKNHFRLSDNEYYVISAIEILSRNGRWCYKSKSHIARDLFISIRTVRSAIRRLHELELIQNKDGMPQFLRPSPLWFEAKKEFEQKVGEKELGENETTESNDYSSAKDDPPPVQSFPKNRKKLHPRIIEEGNIEKNRILDQFLNF